MEKNLLENEYKKIKKELKNFISIKDDIIYHYTSPDGLKGIIKDKKFWFTDIKFLNDSSEDNYVFTLSKKVALLEQDKLDKDFLLLSRSIADSYLNSGTCLSIQNSTRSTFVEKNYFFIASFSLNNDNLELWRNYTKTQNSVGYNITLQNLKFQNPCKKSKLDFGKVIYSENIQINILRSFLSRMNKYYLENKIKDNYSKISEKNFSSFVEEYVKIMEYLNVFLKHPKFVNEDECRYVIYDIPKLKEEKLINKKNHSKKYTNFISPKKVRIKDGVFIPYIEVKFNPSAISSIGISPNINSELLIEGVKRSFLLAELGMIKVWASDIPLRN